MAKPFPQRLRAALGVLFDSTNPREIIRRPLEPRTVGRIVDEVNPTDRRQLVSDSRKLYANVGPAKGAIDAKAMYSVGRSWLPKFEGTDTAWGEQAREWLINQFYPLADIQGRDFQTSLYLASVSVDRDGDVGALLTEYETGFPAIQLIPTQAITMPSEDKMDREHRLLTGPYQGLRCFDGVIINDQGRPVAYYVEEDESLLDLESENEASEYISARDFMLLAEPSWVDQVRGFPGFAHAILDLKDLRTVQGYEKMASALASSIGLLEYNETGMADTSDPTVALGGNFSASGDIVSKEIFGGTVRHYKANSGSKLEAFKSDRPGDAWQRLMDRLIRNAMSGINWPFELAWDISALGGANTRFVIASAMRTVEDRQDLLRPFAKRAVGYACAKAIKNGDLPPSDDWWRWSFTMPPRMTSDYGRDAAAQREDYLQGIINLSDICAERGIDLKQHIAQRSAENEALAAAGLPVPGLAGKLAPTATEPTPVPVMQPQGAQMSVAQLQVDTSPTAEMKAEAERGLAWRQEFNRGGTEVGVARARDIANGRNLSAETIFRMKAYFRRHEVDKQGEGFNQGEPGYPSAGRIAWALWGGDAGYAWAERKVLEIEREQD